MSLPVIIGRVEGVLGEKDPGEMRKDPGKWKERPRLVTDRNEISEGKTEEKMQIEIQILINYFYRTNQSI